MTLQIQLPEELANRLRQEAERRGSDQESIALNVLDQSLPASRTKRRCDAADLVRQWLVEDTSLSDEALSENAALLRALDQNRPSYRKLFEDLSEDKA